MNSAIEENMLTGKLTNFPYNIVLGEQGKHSQSHYKEKGQPNGKYVSRNVEKRGVGILQRTKPLRHRPMIILITNKVIKIRDTSILQKPTQKPLQIWSCFYIQKIKNGEQLYCVDETEYRPGFSRGCNS